MGGSEVESVGSSSNATDLEEVMLFACRKCGQHFTPAEKEGHRDMHNREKRKRASSPNASEATTLFHQVVSRSSENAAVSTQVSNRAKHSTAAVDLAKKKAEMRAESGKRRSIKNYDKNVKPIRYHKG